MGPHLFILSRPDGRVRKSPCTVKVDLNSPAPCSLSSCFLPNPHFETLQTKKMSSIQRMKHCDTLTLNLNTAGVSHWGTRTEKYTLTEKLFLTRRFVTSEFWFCPTLRYTKSYYVFIFSQDSRGTFTPSE